MDKLASLDDLDLPTLIGLAGRLLNARTLEEIRANGYPTIRERDGYVIQHLIAGPITIGELAQRLGVSQQATSKRVVELATLGILTRSFSEQDRRSTVVELSDHGRRMVGLSREVRASLEEQMSSAIGRDRGAFRRGLKAIVKVLDAESTILQRRVPEP